MQIKIKLTIAFDGTDYHGWQRQIGLRTVEGTLTKAISAFMQPTDLIGCSRTDAGVHAHEFCVSYFADTSIPAEKLPIALNTKLPPDIRALRAQYMPHDFHARYSAKSKTYTYTTDLNPILLPVNSRYCCHFPKKVDPDAIHLAASHIIGTHDFAAFMATGSSHKTTVRTVNSLDISHDASANIISFTINANAYLYNMVRIISGTLLYCGIGKIDPRDIPTIIQGCDRRKAGITLPPQGLALTKVHYD